VKILGVVLGLAVALLVVAKIARRGPCPACGNEAYHVEPDEKGGTVRRCLRCLTTF
jgi:hypothetical protein